MKPNDGADRFESRKGCSTPENPEYTICSTNGSDKRAGLMSRSLLVLLRCTLGRFDGPGSPGRSYGLRNPGGAESEGVGT